MSEAEGKVKIEYELEGVEETVAKQRTIEEVLDGVAAALDRNSAVIREMGDASDEAAAKTDNLTKKAVEQGFKLAEYREQVSGAVGALGTLASILGTDSDAGAVVGRMSQFGQLGTQIGGIFGPTGAVVGAIAGALIPALDELTGGFDGVSESAERAAREAENASVRILAAARAARQTQTAQRDANEDLALASSRNLLDRQRASDEAIDARRAELIAQRDAIAQTAARTTGERQANAELRLRFVRGQLGEIEIELQEREQQRRTQEFAADNPQGANTDLRVNMGGRRGGSRGDGRDAERFLSDFRVGLMDEQEARELRRIETVAAAERERFDTEMRMLNERKARDEELQRSQDEWERAAIDRRIAEETELLERQDSKRLQVKRRQEADTRMWQGTQESMLDATLGGANAIGGAFANAFGAAIQGQEDFGTAFVKGMKMQLIQFGVGQVAEGAGALFSAVGLAFTNPPAAGAKAVEGAGKIALGVSLGAAGAAISVPSTPSAEDRAPRMGPAANEGPSGGNVIVNMNSPFVTAGTQAELGRGLTRSIGMSQRRFGRAA